MEKVMNLEKVTLREFLDCHPFYCGCTSALIYHDELYGEVKLQIVSVEDGYLCVQCNEMPDVETFEFTGVNTDNYIVELMF